MNFSKIQEILEHDAKFGPLVAQRDTKVGTRNGEVVYAAMTVKVADAIEKSGSPDKSCSRATVLAHAALLIRGQPAPAGTVAPPVKKAETPETIVVRPAPSVEPKSPDKVQQKAQQVDLAKFVSNGDILKFQGAVAIGQLLAAVYQLAESDCWEGFEYRRGLLNDLLESYEAVSKKHVNFSVKQIIRAKAEDQFRSGS
jgi:hypothetical protein